MFLFLKRGCLDAPTGCEGLETIILGHLFVSIFIGTRQVLTEPECITISYELFNEILLLE
jgi:hypothetical protein